MKTVLFDSVSVWWPEAILSAGALCVILAGAWTRRSGASWPVVTLTWLSLAAAAAALWQTPATPSAGVFFGLILVDGFSGLFRWLALGVVALVVLMASGSRDVEDALRGEYLGLLLFVGVGLMLLAEASHLLMAYVAMELVSLSSYALVGLSRDARASEAALKYLLFGALASGLMLFGMSLIFGLTGELGFAEILRSVEGFGGPMRQALLVAVAFVLVGLGFKISMVPFHMWTPDAYEGAPVPVTALLSVGPKAAGLALLLRMGGVLEPIWPSLEGLLLGLTVVTMTLGNLVALAQTNVKRLLAYSTIAQVGYLLIGFVVNTRVGVEAIMVYLVAYLFMNLGAFACVVAVVNDTGSESVEAFRGLARRAPVLAALCAVCLLSLAGMPPLLGFFGKFLLFRSAVTTGQIPLVLIALLNSAIALYYYVNILRQMYLLTPAQATPLHAAWPVRLAAVACGTCTVALGLFPETLLRLAHASSLVNLL